MKIKALIIFSSILGAFIWVWLFNLYLSLDIARSFYKTREIAVEQKLFRRGWLPDILPKSSCNISVTNDLDLNKSKGSFSFREHDYKAFISYLEEIENKEVVNNESQSNIKAYQYKRWVFWIKPQDANTYYVEYKL